MRSVYDIFFIDGPQQSGKTTLINGLEKSIYSSLIEKHKFPFSLYINELFPNQCPPDILEGFRLGKDLGILDTLITTIPDQKIRLTSKILVYDRGPFSTIYFNLAQREYLQPYILRQVQLIDHLCAYAKSAKNINIHFILVYPQNRSQLKPRERGDGFDNTSLSAVSDWAFNLIDNLVYGKEVSVTRFINDFSLGVEESTQEFIALIAKLIRGDIKDDGSN